MGLGLNSAIHIAHMGMNAAEKSINVSGNNLANSNTFGYKAERPDFVSFLSYTYNYGSTPGQTYTAGTNPQQIGMGVELGSVTTDFTQGGFKEGMTNSDVAINGDGFLIVQNHGDTTQYYTRNGALKINQNFDLTTNTGMYVMGYGVDDKFRIQDGTLTTLKIPIGELHIAEQTENTTIEGIVDAVGDIGSQGTVLRTKPMTDLSKTYPTGEKATVTQIAKPLVEGNVQAAGSTGGEMETGKYQYCFAYVDANGVESNYSIPIPVELEAGQNAASLTGLPNVPEEYSNLRIYRAVDSGNSSASLEYHLVGEVSTPPNSFVDTMSTTQAETKPELHQGRLGESSQYSYQYYMTYTDAYGNESRPVAVTDPKNVNNGQLELSGLPTVDPENNPDGWTGRRIYRSTGFDDTQIYMVQDLPDNMDPDYTFIDRISDAELSDGTHLEMNEAGRGDAQITADSKLLDVGQFEDGRFVQVFEEGTLRFDPSKGGKNLRTAELEVTSQTTVGDYLNFLNEAFGIRGASDGVPADAGDIGKTINGGNQGATVVDGSFYIMGNSGEKNALEMSNDDLKLILKEGRERWIDLGWKEVQETKGVGEATDLEVYDSLGTPIGVRMTLVLESRSNTETVYRWYADSSDNQPTDGSAIASGTGLLRFDQHGNLIDASNTTISVERNDVASVSPLDFDFQMDVGALKALASDTTGLTQTERDGAAAGTLYDYEIKKDGTILGIFDSGEQRILGQIPLATFRNQEGLYKSGDSLYRASTNSGDAKIGIAGTNGIGSIKSNSLELSNTDIGQEIVDMILASAMYRSNAKVMTTSNEMYDALLRII